MRKSLRALVIDDDPQVRQLINCTLGQVGWEVREATTAEGALQLLNEEEWPLVFCDVVLGKDSGYTVLRNFSEIQPKAHVVLMTGHGSAAGALEATALGAQDYLLKPFNIGDVESHADLVNSRLSATRRARHLLPQVENEAYAPDIDLVGRSPAFVETMKMVGRVVSTNLPVLITGESGTGKEVVARTIHRRSQRTGGSFVAINCGALSAELIESELFGHVRGAFTGADRERVGLWEEAHGGTILLDEITETSFTFQVKLLRALQEHEVRRVGSNRSVKVDARVIAATNRDVEREVSEGRFRQDLHFRLNAVTIHLPALRERREDIMPLAKRFARRFSLPEAPPVSFLSETILLLESYHWPGNVRELEHTVMRAVAIGDHTIRPEDLPERIRRPAHGGPKTDLKAGAGENCVLTIDDWWSLDELEGKYLARTLEHTQGNKLAASRLLKVNRKTLDRMIKRHQVDVQTRALPRGSRQGKPAQHE